MRSHNLFDLNFLHDLVQNIYQLVVAKQCQALRNFQFRNAHSFKSYLFKLAIREVTKYVKDKKASGPEILTLPLFSTEPYDELLEMSPGLAFLFPNRQMQMEESELRRRYEILEAEMRQFISSRHPERDLMIFRFYILERFTAKEIADDFAYLELKASSIDTIVVRIRDQIRSHFTEAELRDLLLSE